MDDFENATLDVHARFDSPQNLIRRAEHPVEKLELGLKQLDDPGFRTLLDLLATGKVDAVHVYGNIVTVDLAKGHDSDGLGDAAEVARRAEAAGYDGLFGAEIAHDPFLPLALAAQATSRIELGTGIAVAPEGQDIALFILDDSSVYAINNVSSHGIPNCVTAL